MEQYYQQQKGQQNRQGQQQQTQQVQQGQQGQQGQQWQHQQQHQGYAQQYYGQQQQQYPQQYDAAAHHAYYDQYQQYYAQQQQYQQHQPQALAGVTSNATLAALASALPPSYDTPLPTARSKPGLNVANQTSNNPLAQIQAQYQSSMQLGAAAASAATAALFKSGYSSQTDTTSLSGPSTVLPGIAKNDTSEPGINDKKRKVDSNTSSKGTDTDWYSTYKTPSAQERKAALSATPSPRPALPPKPQVTMNGPKNNRNQRGNKQGNNNNRSEKQTKPSTEEHDDSDSGFHCDACDVTFHEEVKLKVHVAAHRSCPDCAYKASPSLVREHQKLTHGVQKEENEAETSTATTATTKKPDSTPARPGLAGAKKQQISNQNMIHPLAPKLNTPEDIAAWIAQRRKQWPTETNIQKKEIERQEMIAKGQIVDDPPKGKNAFDKKNKNNNINKKLTWKQRQEEARAQKRIKMETEGTTDSAAPINADGSIAPTLEVNKTGDVDEDDDEDMDPEKDAITSKDPTVMGKVLLPSERATRPKRACRYFLKGTCHKGDKCSWSHDAALAAKVQKSVQASVKTEVFRTRPSLLQMLLSGEIKQEKNVLLEAIRFIVDNNFFEKQEPAGALVQEITVDTSMDLS